MINHKVMSMCPNVAYCNGWNDAVDEIRSNEYVVFIDEDTYEKNSDFYPPIGTVGKIISDNDGFYTVEWPEDKVKYNQTYLVAHSLVIKLHF